MSNVAKADNPRNVVIPTCLRAILIKLHEKPTKELSKQDSFHYSAVFSFHFLLLPIGNPLHRDLSCCEVPCLLSSLLVSVCVSLHQSLYPSINTMKEDKIYYKIYPIIRTFSSEFIQLPKHVKTGDSCENHKQASGIPETVLETTFPLFPSLSGSLRHFSATRRCVFTKRSPTASIWLSFNTCYCVQKTKDRFSKHSAPD